MKAKNEKKCKNCGAVFFVSNSIQKYCSRNCFNLSMKRTRKGKGNPAYRNGWHVSGNRKRDGERGFKKIREEKLREIYDKFGYICCEVCGASNAIRYEMHHIIFRSEMPKHVNLHCKDNAIFCCIGCHNVFHKQKNSRSKIVKSRKLWEKFPEIKEKLLFEQSLTQ